MKNDVEQATERLYALLPAIHRIRDLQENAPLRALIAVLAEQMAMVEEDLAQRWDDHFIETCAPWVVPYIGALLGNTPLFDGSRIRQPDTAARLFGDLVGPIAPPEIALRNRADVAKTIGFRRRKATRPMLEDLALAVTGWPARVVEMFQRLGWSQCIRNHLRPNASQCVDLRRIEPLDRIDGPFDTTMRNVDVRPPEVRTGWYNLPNIAFFCWRLRSYGLARAEARRVGGAGDHRFRFSQLGHDLPLFSRWVPEEIATNPLEARLPGPIRRAAFFQSPGDFYGPESDRSFLVIDGVPVPKSKVRCMNLSAWGQPPDDLVAVDVRSGRISFGPDVVPSGRVEVSYHYGFSADLGGGGYARSAWRIRPEALELTVEQAGTISRSFTTIGAALTAWSLAGKPNTIIRIADDATYAEPISVELADDRWLALEAADRRRPHLLLDGPLQLTGDHATASFTLSGLLVEGAVHVEGALGKLRLLHTTLVPGLSLTGDGLPATTEPALIATGSNPSLKVELAFSITGPLRVSHDAEGIWIFDSIADGLTNHALSDDAPPAPGPPLWAERSTFFGAVSVREAGLVTDTIFAAPLNVVRRQGGCVRFSFVPHGSVTPRRFQCQPDQEIAAQLEAAGPALTDAEQDEIRDRVLKRVVPAFTSRRYGQPAYAQLHASSPIQIREGAEDGSEMGVFCHLKQPQRRANLVLRLGEYLPVGLTPAILFVT